MIQLKKNNIRKNIKKKRKKIKRNEKIKNGKDIMRNKFKTIWNYFEPLFIA